VKRSNNYKKLALRLGKEQRHIANIRRDFSQKVTTILTTTYKAIAIEDLNVEGMIKNHKIAKSVSDMAFSELRRQIEYKAEWNKVQVEVADRWFASSKTCHVCGHKRDLTLEDRIYICPHCGTVIDRDLNAALNLLSLITTKVGVDYPELTPADLTALRSRFALNRIATSKVETGKQQKSTKMIL
jgi:putative transposase